MYGRRSLYYDFLLQSLSIEETSTKQKKRETIIIDCTKILDNEVVLCNHLAFSSGLLIYILIILLFCVEVKISHMHRSPPTFPTTHMSDNPLLRQITSCRCKPIRPTLTCPTIHLSDKTHLSDNPLVR